MIFSLCLSGSVLVMTFWPAVRDDNRRIALATVGTIILLHALLSVGCLVEDSYFFIFPPASVTCYYLGYNGIIWYNTGKDAAGRSF